MAQQSVLISPLGDFCCTFIFADHSLITASKAGPEAIDRHLLLNNNMGEGVDRKAKGDM